MREMLRNILLPITVRKENKRLKNNQLDHADEVFALKLQLERAVSVAEDNDRGKEYWRGEAMQLIADLEENMTTVSERNKLLQMQSEEIDGLTQEVSMKEHSLKEFEKEISGLVGELEQVNEIAEEQKAITIHLESKLSALSMSYEDAINDVETLLQDSAEFTAEIEMSNSMLEDCQLEAEHLADELSLSEAMVSELTK